MEVQVDRFFSTGALSRWNVLYKADRPGHGPHGDLIAIVEADSADHACQFICNTRAVSRMDIHAEATKPGRPPELQGEYELVTVKIRKDLLAKIKASGKSRREYIEELLEQ